MKEDPEIVKILKEEERLKLISLKTSQDYEKLQLIKQFKIENSNGKSENSINRLKETNEYRYLENIIEKFQPIFENYAIAITLVDNNERIVSWNKYTEDLLNMNEQELYMKPIRLLYPPEEWRKIRQENVRKKGFKYCMETKIIKKNKGPFDVELSLCVLKSSNGKNFGSIGIIKDIADLKKTREQLKESEERYRTIFENSAVGIILTDKDEQIISWNKFSESLLGMDHTDLYLKKVQSLYPDEEWKKIRSENIRKKGMKHHLETKMFTKNKQIIDIDLSVSVLKNHIGEIIGSIGIISDITKSKKITNELEKSEKRFKQLYDKAPIPYHTLSPKGIITNVNEKWYNTFKYNKDEVIGKSIFDFVIEDERKNAKRSFEKKIQSKNTYSSANTRTYLTKDGEKRIFVINDFFSIDENNDIISIHTTMEDITDITKANEKISNSERKFRSIFENANDAIFLISNNKIIDCNTKAEEMFGCNRDYIIKQKSFGINSMYLPEVDDSKKKIYDKLDEAIKGSSQFFEMKHKKFDGTLFDSEVSLSRIEIDGKFMLLAIVRDITNRKKMEEALLESKKNLSQIIQVSSIPTFIIDQNHKITHWNSACEKLTGLSSKEMIGSNKHWMAFYKKHKPTLVDFLVDKTPEKEICKFYNDKCSKSELISDVYEYEDFFKGFDSLGKWLFLTATPLKDINENIIGAIQTFQNITKNKMVENELKDAHEILQVTVKDLERKVMERTADVEKLLQQKDEFIGQLGHDLKTPLSILVNILPMIQDSKEELDIKNHCNVAIRNIEYIKSLSIGILKIAEINSPHVKFDMEKLNLRDIIGETIENKQINFGNEKIRFINNIENDIIISGDKLRLNEVFDNIINNAVKYSNNDKCLITFDVKKDKDFVIVTISDNGIGMENDQLGNIFRDFYKIDTSRHDLNSAGLGLSICRHIIDLHGGTIWAESEGKDKGSRISFTLKYGGKKQKINNLKNDFKEVKYET